MPGNVLNRYFLADNITMVLFDMDLTTVQVRMVGKVRTVYGVRLHSNRGYGNSLPDPCLTRWSADPVTRIGLINKH